MSECAHCGLGSHYADCPYFEEVCGYFNQCPEYIRKGICEHEGAPLYRKRVSA